MAPPPGSIGSLVVSCIDAVTLYESTEMKLNLQYECLSIQIFVIFLAIVRS